MGLALGLGAPRLCRLRQELELHPGPPDRGHRPTWTLHDPGAGRFFSLGWAETEMLSRWGLGEPQAVAQAVNAETTLEVDGGQVQALDRFLRQYFLCAPQEPAEQQRLYQAAVRKPSPLRWLMAFAYYRLPLFRPDRFLAAALPWLGWLFSPLVAWLVVALAGASGWLVLRQWDAFTATMPQHLSHTDLAALGVVLAFSKLVHELAHAFMAKRQGLSVPVMGVAFIVFLPLLYTDANESWRLADRRQRMAVSAAGILAEVALAALAGVAWALADPGPWRTAFFMLAGTNWVSTLFFNLNPLMRFDGYHLLSDWLRMDNLQPRAFALAGWRLRRHLLGLDEPQPTRVGGAFAWGLTAYALACGVYRFLVVTGISLAIYHLFFKALGAVMLGGYLASSLVQPLYRMARQVGHRREHLRLTWAGALALLALVGLGAWFLVPWDTSLVAQGLYTSAQRTDIYAPEAGRLANQPVASGLVRAGQTLFILESPELTQETALARVRLERLERQLAVQGFDARLQEVRLILEAQAQEARSGLDTLARRQKRLVVTAPHDGRLEPRLEPWRAGDWVGRDDHLAQLVDPEHWQIIAHVPETQLRRLRVGDWAVFRPYLREWPPVRAQVVSISEFALTELTDMAFATSQGGTLDVRASAGGRPVPMQAYYRVLLAPEPGAPRPDRELEGMVDMEGRPESLATRLARKVAGLFIRESVL